MSILEDLARASMDFKSRDIGVAFPERPTVVIPMWILAARPDWEPEIRELVQKSEEENQPIRFILYEDGD